MPNVWMIRAGEGGRLISHFANGYVAIGWQELGDMTAFKSRSKIKEKYLKSYPDERKGAVNNQIAMFYKFRSVLAKGDKVISYDTRSREYLVGNIVTGWAWQDLSALWR